MARLLIRSQFPDRTVYYPHFINAIEARNGVELNDPVLKLFRPIDLSVFIFSVIYVSIIIGLITLLNTPRRLMFALQVYALVVLVRIITLYLTPLNAPPNMIPLVDPIVNNLGTGQLLTKDLFFSGHTATMFFLFLVSENKKMRLFFFFGFVIIAIAVVLQHVHYTIDVVAAPFFTYTAFRIVSLLRNNYQY
ncbi:MAG: phosphatase PAP2-related protein [Ignavibacteriaceae bacterium]